jgi:hypothetical protein
MAKKTVEQLEIEKYVDDAISAIYKQIKSEVKTEFAIKLIEGIVLTFCGIILTGFVGFLLYTIGWKQ